MPTKSAAGKSLEEALDAWFADALDETAKATKRSMPIDYASREGFDDLLFVESGDREVAVFLDRGALPSGVGVELTGSLGDREFVSESREYLATLTPDRLADQLVAEIASVLRQLDRIR